MKKKGLLLCIAFLTLFGVMYASFYIEKTPSSDSIHYSQFPHEYSLSGKGFIIDGEFVRFPFRIRQKGDYIYILDMHGERNFCHILSKDKVTNVVSFARRGNGPEEILQAMDLHVVSEDSIWLYDTNKREITLWGYSSDHCTVLLKDCVKFDDKIDNSSNCSWKCDSVFFFTDKSGHNRILMVDKSGKIEKHIGTIPSDNKVDNNKLGILAQAWNSYVHYNPHHKMLVTATQLGEVIEIYYLETNKRQVIVGPYGEPQYATTNDGWAVPTGIMGFSDVQITDNYIYAVFHGRSFKDIIRDPHRTLDGGEYIHVYDLSGQPVCRFVLDRAVYGIDVDEENGVIWATDVNSEEQIIKYKIPGELFCSFETSLRSTEIAFLDTRYCLLPHNRP